MVSDCHECPIISLGNGFLNCDIALRVKMCETLDSMKFTEQGERGL
jgi:hypothetical protein